MNTITIGLIIIIRRKGKYLLTFRVEENPEDTYHNIWQIPGGTLEFGETMESGIKREAKEELGIEIEIIQCLPKIFESIRKDWHGLLFCYFCKMKNKNNAIILNEEASKFHWFLPSEVKTLRSFPETYDIICEAEKIY